jgi:hypothetical protein
MGVRDTIYQRMYEDMCTGGPLHLALHTHKQGRKRRGVRGRHGKKFAQHERIVEELKPGYDFAHPHAARERGAN